ncbi:sodium-dependent transporter [Bacillus carboniphilus]|uniref:Transporter n=1 Tax=Bacillus carboniphilus TaxID=86663 RepID=A0ABY9JYD1_9BACI|nr:sodium-dependent transporter [Bacillus carboniphilus]WLR43353.1 sodium-dependent transporter [Bacillus carboniphilus]
MQKQVEQWSSNLSFVLAAAGSAIGLGAIWKFPYMVGTNGGGMFLLLFIFFTLLIGLPLLMSEFVIGRGTQLDAVESYKQLAPNTYWHYVGRLGIITSIILLSFYSVVGGWITIYLYKALTGQLAGLSEKEYGALFGETISNPSTAIIGQLLFLAMTILVVSRGIQKGIERASKIMMPALFIIFIILIIRSVTLDGAWEGLVYFLKPNLSAITAESILYAMGQSFFALSVGVSVMVTYSSYLSKEENLPKSAGSIVLLNILVSFLAGIAIFPAVFSFGLNPGEGPVLLFNVLPTVFSQMPFGMIFFTVFLILFLFATLTSAFSLLEIVVASIAKNNLIKRKKVAWISGLAIFILGIPSALSFGVLNDLIFFGEKTFFDVADFLVSNTLLPLGSLLIAIFVSRILKREELFKEFSQGSKMKRSVFSIWYFLIRYFIPLAIIIVFLNVLGLFDLFL